MEESQPTFSNCMNCEKTLIIDDKTPEARDILTGELMGYVCYDHLMKDDDGNILTESPFTNKELRYSMLQGWIELGLNLDRIMEFQREIQSYTIDKLEKMLSLTHDSLWEIREELVSTDQRKDEQEVLADLSILRAEFRDRGINCNEWL